MVIDKDGLGHCKRGGYQSASREVLTEARGKKNRCKLVGSPLPRRSVSAVKEIRSERKPHKAAQKKKKIRKKVGEELKVREFAHTLPEKKLKIRNYEHTQVSAVGNHPE